MKRDTIVRRRCFSCLLFVTSMVLSASSQTQPPRSPNDEIKSEAVELYAGAHPYMDEPAGNLRKLVRELAGMQAGDSPEPLSDLLAKIAAKADELLQKVPDLISDEVISQTQQPLSQGLVANCVGADCMHPGTFSGREETFSYIILTHPAQNGRLVLQEYRTAKNGKPISSGSQGPYFQGFISAWIVFSSANQVESHFRYLGQQKIDGHQTFVLGFAQVPGSVESPGLIFTGRESIPMLLQGIAWIDQSDYRIVRLRTDLLAPQPEILMQRQTASILFGPVHIASFDSPLWLPLSVHAEMESRGQFYEEQHKYSKYRLYQAKSKIILSPGN